MKGGHHWRRRRMVGVVGIGLEIHHGWIVPSCPACRFDILLLEDNRSWATVSGGHHGCCVVRSPSLSWKWIRSRRATMTSWLVRCCHRNSRSCSFYNPMKKERYIKNQISRLTLSAKLHHPLSLLFSFKESRPVSKWKRVATSCEMSVTVGNAVTSVHLIKYVINIERKKKAVKMMITNRSFQQEMVKPLEFFFFIPKTRNSFIFVCGC